MRTLEQLFIDRRNDFVELMRDFEGSYFPRTSWENMTDNALQEFKEYCENMASDFLKNSYESGINSDDYMLKEFGHMLWTLAQCIECFDVKESEE